MLEWLFSPVVYMENSSAIAELREIAQRLYSSTSLYYHYYHMANGNYRQYLQDKPEIILKKYLYVLRPLVALLFLEQQQQLPPTNFLGTLAQVQIPEEVRLHIHDLIARKQAGAELGMGTPDTVLHAFITKHLDKWHKPPTTTEDQTELSQKLEQVLQRILAEG
jgi:predicted nucleotidyltransferase